MDLQTMAMLGISVRQPWIDHPYTDRGRYVDQYKRGDQYTSKSGWSSLIASGGLPASHYGGVVPDPYVHIPDPRGRKMYLDERQRRKKRRKDRKRRARGEFVQEEAPDIVDPLEHQQLKSRIKRREGTLQKHRQQLNIHHGIKPWNVGVRMKRELIKAREPKYFDKPGFGPDRPRRKKKSTLEVSGSGRGESSGIVPPYIHYPQYF